MDLVSNLLLGFQNAVTLQNLLYCFTGVSVGTLIGVLPGMGPVATVAMLLPITYALDPSAALIMLAASTTAPSTAAPRRPSSSTFRARPPQW